MAGDKRVPVTIPSIPAQHVLLRTMHRKTIVPRLAHNSLFNLRQVKGGKVGNGERNGGRECRRVRKRTPQQRNANVPYRGGHFL